ncbi:MAG: RNA methyltransferase [Gammaproteobacteria bacterium]|nr:RNA methyltransferase [Gammaproteobacteria bacterium]
MLDNIRIILCQPSHPGNIGACARAMKNMGLNRLTLIRPEIFPHASATERASGADDVLANAKVVETLEEGIANCHWVFGTSARSREFPWPQMTSREAAEKVVSFAQEHQEIGILFGTERSGLTNAELQRCDFHLTIPTHPSYSSLNLSQAVQVVAYEIYQHWLTKKPIDSAQPVETHFEKATKEEIAGLLKHFEETAIKIGFMDPDHPKKLLPRLKRLFSKAQLEKEEINILRGFLKLTQR